MITNSNIRQWIRKQFYNNKYLLNYYVYLRILLSILETNISLILLLQNAKLLDVSIIVRQRNIIFIIIVLNSYAKTTFSAPTSVFSNRSPSSSMSATEIMTLSSFFVEHSKFYFVIFWQKRLKQVIFYWSIPCISQK